MREKTDTPHWSYIHESKHRLCKAAIEEDEREFGSFYCDRYGRARARLLFVVGFLHSQAFRGLFLMPNGQQAKLISDKWAGRRKERNGTLYEYVIDFQHDSSNIAML